MELKKGQMELAFWDGVVPICATEFDQEQNVKSYYELSTFSFLPLTY